MLPGIRSPSPTRADRAADKVKVVAKKSSDLVSRWNADSLQEPLAPSTIAAKTATDREISQYESLDEDLVRDESYSSAKSMQFCPPKRDDVEKEDDSVTRVLKKYAGSFLDAAVDHDTIPFDRFEDPEFPAGRVIENIAVYYPPCSTFVPFAGPDLPKQPKSDSTSVDASISFDWDSINFQQLVDDKHELEGVITIHAPRLHRSPVVQKACVDLLLVVPSAPSCEQYICSVIGWCNSVLGPGDNIGIVVYGSASENLSARFKSETSWDKVMCVHSCPNSKLTPLLLDGSEQGSSTAEKWLFGSREHATNRQAVMLAFSHPRTNFTFEDECFDQLLYDMENTPSSFFHRDFSVATFQVNWEKFNHGFNTTATVMDPLIKTAEKYRGQYHMINDPENLLAAVGLYLCQTVLDVAADDVSIDITNAFDKTVLKRMFAPRKLEVLNLTLQGAPFPIGTYTNMNLGKMAYGSRRDVVFKAELQFEKVPHLQERSSWFRQVPRGFFGMRRDGKAAVDSSDLDCCLICLQDGQKRNYSCGRDNSTCKFAICEECVGMLNNLPCDEDGNEKCPHCNLPASVWKPSDIHKNDLVFLTSPVAIGKDKILPGGCLGQVCADQSFDAQGLHSFPCKFWKVKFFVRSENEELEEVVEVPETVITSRGAAHDMTEGDEVCILHKNPLGLAPGTRGKVVHHKVDKAIESALIECAVKTDGIVYVVPCCWLHKIHPDERQWLAKPFFFNAQVSYVRRDSFGNRQSKECFSVKAPLRVFLHLDIPVGQFYPYMTSTVIISIYIFIPMEKVKTNPFF